MRRTLGWFLLAIAAAGCPNEPEPVPDDDDDAAPAAGDLRWVATGGGPAEDACVGAAPAAGGTWVASCTTRGFSTWGGSALEPVGDADVVLLGLDGADGATAWQRTVASAGFDDALIAAPVALPDGRVAVAVRVGGPTDAAGIALDAALDGDLVGLLVAGDGTVDAAVRLLSGALFEDLVTVSLAPRPEGGLLLAASGSGPIAVRPGAASEAVTEPVGELDVVLAWLDDELEVEAVRRLGTEGAETYAKAVPLPGGGAVLAGVFSGTLAFDASVEARAYDAYVAEVDGEGEPRWSLAFGTDGWDYARGLARTSDGAFVVAGYFNYGGSESALSVPGHPEPLEGDEEHASDWFVLRLSADGEPLRLSGCSSVHADTALSVEALPGGGAAVSGFANDDSELRPGELLFSDGGLVPVPVAAAVLVAFDADGARSWTRVTHHALAASVSAGDDALAQGHWFASGAVFGEGEPGQREPASRGDFDGAITLHRMSGG